MFGTKRNKIFCISMQRSGTTSVGEFFRHFKYNVAGYDISLKNKWTKSWLDGNYKQIFKSKDFLKNQVFEDDPWWCPEFYKVLYHEFKNAKFILLTRPPEDWFKSMINHSGGKTLGNTEIHCKIYRREKDFVNIAQKFDRHDTTYNDNLLDLKQNKELYLEHYTRHNHEVISFFEQHDSSKLFYGDLYDKDIWQKMGAYFSIDVPKQFNIHANKSNK
ncbi:sulfotransferase [Marinilabilia rubra]|uniref:Sulfotransferase family protein n=1 Tax=Marinilabilia rubra TaxID=2162893 RepID=A0A2U2B3Y4_9BACT|nr:sulfotransferase [Marinilabilia rubra]PWD97754.1 hypothetical protein DDZ16_19150 [Marinilabilia rubra]